MKTNIVNDTDFSSLVTMLNNLDINVSSIALPEITFDFSKVERGFPYEEDTIELFHLHIHNDDFSISTSVYFTTVDEVVAYIKTVLDTQNFFMQVPYDFPTMFIKIRKNLDFKSHYSYLNAVIDKFWLLVFKKSLRASHHAGIVVAHGDKGFGYKDVWQEAGIPYRHGMLLYLLTYTSVFKAPNKPYSYQWVIDNYPKYLPLIKQAEQETLDSILNQKVTITDILGIAEGE